MLLELIIQAKPRRMSVEIAGCDDAIQIGWRPGMADAGPGRCGTEVDVQILRAQAQVPVERELGAGAERIANLEVAAAAIAAGAGNAAARVDVAETETHLQIGEGQTAGKIEQPVACGDAE